MSTWSEIVNAAKSLAPSLTVCVDGPLAGAAVTEFEKVFGLTPQPNQTISQRTNAVAQAFSAATPDQLAAARKADQDFQVKMAELGYKDAATLASLALYDGKRASQTQIHPRTIVVPFIALVVTIGFFGVMGLLTFVQHMNVSHDAIMLMLGTLGAAWGAIMQYYFGTSEAHHETTKMLAELAHKE